MKKIKIIIDILMYLIFIVLMGHHITENLIHEILGSILFVLFIVHHILNYRFYKTIFKGKYKLKRLFMVITDIALMVAMIGMIISAVNISSDVFSFLNVPTTIFGRKLHMISTSWGFVIMSIHLGLHIGPLINKLNRKMKDNTFEYVYYLILILITIYGLYCFIKLDFISDMFVLNAFKYYDYNELPIIFYLHTVSSSLFIGLITYFINNLKLKRKKEK